MFSSKVRVLTSTVFLSGSELEGALVAWQVEVTAEYFQNRSLCKIITHPCMDFNGCWSIRML